MDTLHTLALVTLFAPLGAAVLITCFTLKHRGLSAALAVGGIVAGLVASVMMAVQVGGGDSPAPWEMTWLEAGGITMRFGVTVDALSVLMSLVVGIVGTAVFVYSTGYMKGEEGWSRYFACLSLFAFSMLGIVFSTNLVQTFIFWELVGVSSYSLIGYYFHKPSAVDAGKKAFLTNRIGDFGMTVGILWMYFTLVSVVGAERASFSFHEIMPLFQSGALAGHEHAFMWSALLIFTGAMAKSAQVPLHVWLPDAMEGPTPVSALMHAATMVAAGVYLVARTYFFFAPYPEGLHIVAWVGGITALLAALMAFVQYDIKKVLAYSTLSQLGYMVMALGLFGPVAAMFHLMTHAFFKGLLFLGAGSVIHGCHHEQDMRHMGGLIKKMPVTAWTFWIGSLALAGIAPLAGFWSKDAILGTALHHSMPLYLIGVLVAFMTAAYMGRTCIMTFHGEYRGHAHPHESPASMTGPLVGLAALSVVGGFFNWPMGIGIGEGMSYIENLLIGDGGPIHVNGVAAEHFAPMVAVGGTVAALVGFFVAVMFYGKRSWSIDGFVDRIRPAYTLVLNKFYFDEFYDFLVQGVQQRVADFCAYFEKSLLIGVLVNGLGAIHRWMGGQIRLLLDGHLHRYVTMAMLGAVFLFALMWMGS